MGQLEMGDSGIPTSNRGGLFAAKPLECHTQQFLCVDEDVSLQYCELRQFEQFLLLISWQCDCYQQ